MIFRWLHSWGSSWGSSWDTSAPPDRTGYVRAQVRETQVRGQSRSVAV